MLTGAAPEVAHGFRAAAARAALVGVALALVVASCRPSRPSAPSAGGTAEATAAPPPRGKQIVIAYSSNILAEYEPCG